MIIKIKEHDLIKAAKSGMDDFLTVIIDAFKQQVGDELNADTMQQLTSEQITLWGYLILRDELMDGGFIQLIYNGYGPFFFENPFAKAMRLWGLQSFSKLLYKAKKIYDENKADLTRERSDDDFMAMFEQYPSFDELDDEFVEEEENITSLIAHYVDNNLSLFVEVEK